MSLRKSERDQDNFSNIFAPPGLHSFQVGDDHQKSPTLEEEDNHFLQYVDKCKSQIAIDRPHIKIKQKGNKKIIRLINNSHSSSKIPQIDENKSQINKQPTISSAQQLQDDTLSQHQASENESKLNESETFAKRDEKRKFHSVHIDQAQKTKNEDQKLNLVDKFLVAVISPTKQRQFRNIDSISVREQNSLDLANSLQFEKNTLVQQGVNTSQISDLINQQKQLLLQQLNKNHSLSISLSRSKTPLAQPAPPLRSIQNNNINSLKEDDSQVDSQIFKNRLIIARSNQNSSASQITTTNHKQYFDSTAIAAASAGKNQLFNQQNEEGQTDSKKLFQNNSFTANHYAGNYNLNQNMNLPSNKTMDNLLNEHDDNDNTMKSMHSKTEFEANKQKQMKQMEEKYKQQISNKQIEMQLIASNGNTTQSTKNKNTNQENILNILSSSNIGFGIPFIKSEDNAKKNNKLQHTYSLRQQNLRNSSPNNNSANNGTPAGMIYYNNLSQLSVMPETHYTKRKRTKPNLSISPNIHNFNQNYEIHSQKNALFNNEYSASHSQKFAFHKNSVFDSLGQKERGQMMMMPSTSQNKDQNSSVNRSFDFAFNMRKTMQQQQQQQRQQSLNTNIERNASSTTNQDNSQVQNISTFAQGGNLINQKNSLQSKNVVYVQQNGRYNYSVTPTSNTEFQQQAQFSSSPLNNSNNTNNLCSINSTSYRVGKGQLYFSQQQQSQQIYSKQLTPLAAAGATSSNMFGPGTLRTEGSEDYHIRKKRTHMQSLKRSPQKGNSMKSKDRQSTTTPTNKMKKTHTSKVTQSELERMSAATGMSPSFLRKSLQHRDQIANNLINSSMLNDAYNSIQNPKNSDSFSFQPLDQNGEPDKGGVKVNHLQNGVLKRAQLTNSITKQYCQTEGNRNSDDEDIDAQEDTFIQNGRFRKYEQQQSTVNANQKISRLFQDTILKRNQYNSINNKVGISNNLELEQSDLKTPLKQTSIQVENNSILGIKSGIKTPIKLIKQFLPSTSASVSTQNTTQLKDSPHIQNPLLEIENNQSKDKPNTTYLQRDKNTRFIHLCVVRNTQEFTQFLQEKTNALSDFKRKQSISPNNSNNNTNNLVNTNSNTNNNNTNGNNNSHSATMQNFKKQISIETLQEQDDVSYYLKVICIPKQKHLIYLTEMSIKYAQDKTFYSNFYQLLQRLNQQENLTPHEPYKFIYNNSFTQVTNIFEVQDSVPLLIVSKQKLFSSRSNLIEEMINFSPSPSSQARSRLSNQNNSHSGFSPIVPSPHVGYLNKSSMLGLRVDQFQNSSNLLQTTIKNSIRDKMRAQSCLEHHSLQAKSNSRASNNKNERSPKNPSTDINSDIIGSIQIKKISKTPLEMNSIIELNPTSDRSESNATQYQQSPTDKYSQDKDNSNQHLSSTPQNINKQLFDFDGLSQQSPLSLGIQQGKIIKKNSDLKQQNQSFSCLMSSPTGQNSNKKGAIQSTTLGQTQQLMSPSQTQNSLQMFTTLSCHLNLTTSNKAQQDNVRNQRVNILRQFLSKFDIPSQKYLQEQLNVDAFWNHTKNEIDDLFVDYLCMAQNNSHFLDRNFTDILEIDNLRMRISKIFKDTLSITFQVLQKQYSQIRKIKNETVLKSILFQICQERDLPSNEFAVLKTTSITWSEFLRFHALFLENKWDRDEKIQFIENTFNIEQEKSMVFSVLKQRLIEILSHSPPICKKLTLYIEQNSQTNKDGLQFVSQARLRELICKEQLITTQEIITALLYNN